MSDHTEIGAQVSVESTEVYGAENDGETIALVDCGVKFSMIESFVERGATVHVLPHDATPADVRDVDPDILFISNGPGDPENYGEAVSLVQDLVDEYPVAGICLGQQIVSLALGGTTEKMAFGHRGVNQPVMDLESGRVVMTTQNHGYTVDDPGPRLEVAQRNVNDETPEGLAGVDCDVLTRQYHPEANPGPEDTLDFFDEVLAMTDTASSRAIPCDD